MDCEADSKLTAATDHLWRAKKHHFRPCVRWSLDFLGCCKWRCIATGLRSTKTSLVLAMPLFEIGQRRDHSSH